MNFDKEIQQAKIAHVEELLREAMDEAKQNGITPICEAFYEAHNGKDAGYCILEAYRAKHGEYPYRGLVSQSEELAIRNGWDCYPPPDTIACLSETLQRWHSMGWRLRQEYKPVTAEHLREKLQKECNASL